jgi:flagellar basal-body rod protein FlgB
MSSLFDSSTVPLLEQVVNFTQARHGVLAGNIANLDTPGYRTQDLSPEVFQERLKDAVDQRRRAYSTSHVDHVDSPGYFASPGRVERAEEAMHAATDSMGGMLRHDENNSSLEVQVSEIAKNNQIHNMALSLMTAQFRLLRAAITERA